MNLYSYINERKMNKMTNPPIKKFKVGSVEVALWENESTKGKFLSSTLNRSFKDQNGEWKTTSSFRVNDIPCAVMALQEAFKYSKTKNEDSL